MSGSAIDIADERGIASPHLPLHSGVALHGTYWHDLFGVARMSHGCVNLSLWAAEWVYGWAPLNTPVTVTY